MHPAPLCWDLICSSERRFEHHNVRVVRGVVDRDALLATFGTGERVAGKCRCHHPVHQFDNLRLGRGKIDVRQAIQYLQHVEVVAQLPIALVGPHLRRQVWRIHNEHHPLRMAVLIEQLEPNTERIGLNSPMRCLLAVYGPQFVNLVFKEVFGRL